MARPKLENQDEKIVIVRTGIPKWQVEKLTDLGCKKISKAAIEEAASGDSEINRILRSCISIATTDSKGLASLKRFISENLKDKAK